MKKKTGKIKKEQQWKRKRNGLKNKKAGK